MVIAIIISSFTVQKRSIAGKDDRTNHKLVSLYWFSGVNYTGRMDTKVNEITPSECSNTGSAHCEDGYDGNDFNVLNDPTSGLNSSATINDFIKKP